jgi:hypothetical protein
MAAFDVVKKYLDSATIEPAAVEICSPVLEAHIWIALDPDFAPNDGLAVFYADELKGLSTKTVQQLRAIHQTKLVFGPGSRVKQ